MGVGRFAIVVGVALVVPLAGAGPAWAHTGGGAEPSNWESPVTRIEPAMPGVDVRTIDNGDFVELVNRSSVEVTVLGYDGEEYLRIGPDGVFENTRSAATYLNTTKDGRTPVPDDAHDPDAPPAWRQVSGEHRYVWHDHRTHWMRDSLPEDVTADSGQPRAVSDWSLTMRYGTSPVTVSGTLSWVPPPSPWPWLGLAVGLAAAGTVLGWARRRWRTVVPSLVAVLVGFDVVHVAAEPLPSSADHGVDVFATGWNVGPSVLAWLVGGWAMFAIARARPSGPLAAALVGALVAVLNGAGDLATLTHARLPFAGPDWIARLCVAVAIGLGIAALAVAWRAWRRDQPVPPRRVVDEGIDTDPSEILGTADR